MTHCRPHGLHRAMMLVAALTLSSFALDLRGQAYAQGSFPEFAATTGGLRGSFMRPSTARLANGKFVLVMGLQASPLINSGIYFQIYTPQGEPVGNLTRVKPTLMLSDHAPATAAATGNGAFVVVWAYREHFDAPDRILGQRYSAAGAKKGSEFQINQTNPGHIQDQKVVSLADGGFVVVWNAGPTSQVRERSTRGVIMTPAARSVGSSSSTPRGQKRRVSPP